MDQITPSEVSWSKLDRTHIKAAHEPLQAICYSNTPVYLRTASDSDQDTAAVTRVLGVYRRSVVALHRPYMLAEDHQNAQPTLITSFASQLNFY